MSDRHDSVERRSLLQQHPESDSDEAAQAVWLPGYVASTLPAARSISSADKVRVAAVMFCFMTTGMYLTAIGALLVQLEAWYDLKDSTTAFIFPTGVTGYVCGTLLLPAVLKRYGWRGMACTAPMLHALGAVTLSTAPVFPALLCAHFCAGLGVGLSDAGCCAWASKLPLANVVQGLMHGSFSVGCILGPVACVAVTKRGFDWFVYYRYMIVLSCLEVLFLNHAFRKESLEIYRATHINDTEVKAKSSRRAKIVWMVGLFYFFYLGIEASFTNWISAYMERVRHVDAAAASLSSSIFWFGMASGRFLLGPITDYFGLSISIAVYIGAAIFLTTVFSFAHHLALSLTALGATGFFLAPMFPTGIVLLAQKLSMQEYVGGVAAAAALGQVGGAGSQLLIGFAADRLGLDYLIDVVLGLLGALLLIWLVSCTLA